jgi:hypothetical protein
MMMTTEQQNKRTRLLVIALATMALCFYFGFIIATGMNS